MKIKTLHGFTGNGVLKGTLVALDDSDNPLGWEEHGNWSNSAFLRKAAISLAEDTGIELDRARQLLVNARKAARTAAGIDGTADAAPEIAADQDRERIIVNGRFLRDLAADSWALMSAAGEEPEFFKLGDRLAHLEVDNDRVYSRVLTRDALIGHLDRLGDYMAAKDGGFTPTFPPKALAENMLADAAPPLPPLQGVVNTPVIGPNGDCIVTEGYDPITELFINLKGLKVPAVADHPTESEVTRARSLILDELLADFPFTSESDKAHAVAALLTPMARPMIKGPTPLFLFEAPTAGTGKGLLADVVVNITTGSAPAVMTEARGTEEWRKRITSTLLSAPTITLIDNVQRPLDAAALAAVLTAEVWEDRELGASRMVRLPVRTCWIATGNNVTLSGELARRTIRTRMDAAVERPWERKGFKHDPLSGWVRSNRGYLCWALMTLVRAWVSANHPEPSDKIGSFEEWSRVVGGIITSADIPGFLENRAEVYDAAEAEGDTFRAFVEVWCERFGGNRVTVDDLHNLAKETHLLSELRGGQTDQGARVVLGRTIARMRDRRVDAYWVRVGGKVHGALTYWLQIAENLESDPETSSPPSPSPPQLGGKGEDTGEDGEDNQGYPPLDGQA